jgi:transcriptional regulatory protein RtcR
MTQKRRVAIGLVGATLDGGKGAARWARWRPTVALGQHEDLVIDRFELLYQPAYASLADTLEADLATVSPETTVRRHALPLTDAWDFEEVYGALLDFARDYPFDLEQEEYLLHITTGTHVVQICLFLLVEARYIPARLVQTAPPARGGVGKPGGYRVIDLDLSRYDKLAQRFAREQRAGLAFLKAGIDTRNAAFNELIARLERVAIASKSPILLTGPTGAGKSQLARRIYELKRQRRQLAGRCVEVNCATLRGDGAMSTLFGHRRGAFTGAQHDRPGLLRAADGGLLFLDEIGELGLDEQAMLLRALEERRFLPVGADQEVESDFQLIAGTNRDLAAAVAAGRFREDLLARIDLWTFRLPGLAERREDLAPNLDYEIERTAAKLGLKVTMSREARARFLAVGGAPQALWSGNFRDLNAAVTRMATLAEGGRVTVADVDAELGRLRARWGEPPAPESGIGVGGPDDRLLAAILGPERLATLDSFDRPQLAHVVRTCQAARSLAAAGRRLFAVSRVARTSVNDADRVRKYLLRFGLTWGQVVAARAAEAAR